MSNARESLAAAFYSSFTLTRHSMDEQPDGPAQHVALVQLPGSTALKAAQWRDGEWLNDRRKAFPETPLWWFSVDPTHNG